MQIIKTIKEMQAFIKKLKAEGKTIGFVPTMGALHEGHLSLVRHAMSENDVTIVSIFVNPTQFGPDEDFEQYPHDEEDDIKKLSALDVAALFMPDAKEMYPGGFSISITVGRIGGVLCGRSRPGHFDGVATVVAKLLNSVMSDRAYFGQKDFQQTVVIKKLVRELNFDTEIIVCPIVREPDGLAMSSRNSYLNNEERRAATILYKSLHLGNKLIAGQSIKDSVIIRKEIEGLIESEPLAKIDYIEIVDPESIEQLDTIGDNSAICLAVNVGKTRLIDNIIINNR